MDNQLEQIWNNCLNYIRENINIQSYKTWFEPIKPVKLDGNALTIQVPSQFFYEWLEEHYVNLLHRTIKKELGSNGRLEYSIVMDNVSNNQPFTINIPTSGAKSRNPDINIPTDVSKTIKNPFIIPGIKKVNIDSQLNPSYNFSNFVEGTSNRLGRSAGLAVSKNPGGTSFNPLLIYGGVGLGKTHLAQAIGNEVKVHFPEKTVLYVTTEKFTNQFIDSLKNNTMNDFMNFYYLIDVLIIDDIQFLAGREKTQDIFFHIFNHLHQENKQLVLTSDCVPKDLKGIEERLLSRFKWGLFADLGTPDFETRIAILRSKMYKDGIELSEEVVEYLAANITTNIRELEGALVSLLAHASLNQNQPDLDLAKLVLRNFVKNVTMELSIENIQKVVAGFFNISVESLKDSTRKREVVQARQIAMYFTKKLTKQSLKVIGNHFGGRDHSTVIHSCQTVEDLCQTDKNFKTAVEDINKKFRFNTPV